MKYQPWQIPLLVGLTLVLAGASSRNFRGQESRSGKDQPIEPASQQAPGVQDLLIRPFPMPFSRPTSLEEVATILGDRLGIPVVLDRAALIRLDLEPTDSVQLALEGVRLKTSLQLLLDQVGMTFRVIPEDNLLILTDDQSSADPFRLILDELSTLHLEIHDLRDDILRLQEAPNGDQDEPSMKKPTIIEELQPEDERDAADPGQAEPTPAEPPARKRRKSA